MPRPPASRTALDRVAVVRAAAALVNAEGPEALTINRLARELGVQPPSLYNHIAGLDDLLRELSLLSVRSLGERIAESAVGRSGRAGVMALAEAYRAYVREFPGLYQISLRASGNMSQPSTELQAAEERVVRTVLVLIDSFGLTGDDAIHAVRALRSAIHGFATLEVAGGFGMVLDRDESFRRLIGMLIAGIERAAG